MARIDAHLGVWAKVLDLAKSRVQVMEHRQVQEQEQETQSECEGTEG